LGKALSIVRAIAAVTAVNFIAFLAMIFYLGGDALNGYVRDGHYFLGLHSNGPFTEVSPAVFSYSRWHALSVIMSFGFILVAEFWRRRRANGS
jgi:hypothetical protein